MPQQWSDGYYYYNMMPVQYDGAPYLQNGEVVEVTPGSFDDTVRTLVRDNPELNAQLFSLSVADIKAYKEAEFRNMADEWMRVNIRCFEASVVAFKKTGLTAPEIVVRDKLLANYNALVTAVTSVRTSNADWLTILQMQWTPPSI
jgi:hypothetical protein